MKLILAICFLGVALAAKRRPHIVHIVADDLGWNDVSWHDASMHTPNLQKLVEDGVILENFYVQTSCSPTRSSLMTGYYSSNIGSQHLVYKPDRPHGLPTWLKTLPEVLKSGGYTTYGVGKWHLGYCNESYIPTNRGFDHFYGFYLGSVDYINHKTSEFGPYNQDQAKYLGFDFHDDGKRVEGPRVDDVYTSILFEKRLEKIIKKHDQDNPMYLYVAFQLPHSPLELPDDEFSQLYTDTVSNEDRVTYSGQVTMMDSIVGDLKRRMKKEGMWDNTLVLFHSDNGGDVLHAASNFPLRGNKGTYFEGGIRAVAFVHGKGIKKTGYTNREMIHVSDIFPTLIEAAGCSIDYNIDGVSAWCTISKGKKSDRTGFLITIDEQFPEDTTTAALRDGKWKYIEGIPAFSKGTNGIYWYPTQYDAKAQHFTDAGDVFDETSRLLFNMEEDPLEMFNVADSNPDVVAQLSQKLDEYRKTAWTDFPESDPACDPNNYDGWWTSGWCKL
ncbi:arylsulfatase B-like [Ptychodera flava]|uniref:arylsulfatase B-like n=1 Tax=Ptychodera flava TaxID=63121 RepID=UPI00396A1447